MGLSEYQNYEVRMEKQERIQEVGKYIEKYYVPGNDDIELEDEHVKGFFDRITEFLEGKKDRPKEERPSADDVAEASEAPVEQRKEARPPFDMSTAKKTTVTHSMSEMMVSNRKIDDLMSQMDETFSQRLIRMIKERDMTESEAYKKAYVDRRHFSKIKKDEYYLPTKKTVLAFSIALELSLDETKDLLRSAGYALSRSSKFDIIIVYFIENKNYDMFEINDVLYEYDQPIFE